MASSQTNLSWSVFATTFENEVEGVKDALLHRPEFTAGGSCELAGKLSNWSFLLRPSMKMSAYPVRCRAVSKR